MDRRKTAYDILYRVFHEHGFASLMMRDLSADQQDLAFVSQLVYGTIRNRSFLQYQWQDLVKKAGRKSEVLLDMACYELFFMRAPAYAIID